MDKITICKNPNASILSAPLEITPEELKEAVHVHRADVATVMDELGNELSKMGENHDWTKQVFADEYFRDFYDNPKDTEGFKASEWYQQHITAERHHLLDHFPEDVNLLDVIEMLVDHVCNKKMRGIKNMRIAIPAYILEKAMHNTVKLIDKNTVVE